MNEQWNWRIKAITLPLKSFIGQIESKKECRLTQAIKYLQILRNEFNVTKQIRINDTQTERFEH